MYIEIRPFGRLLPRETSKIRYFRKKKCKEFPRFYFEPLVELISNLLFFLWFMRKTVSRNKLCGEKMGTKRYNSFRSTNKKKNLSTTFPCNFFFEKKNCKGETGFCISLKKPRQCNKSQVRRICSS